MWLSIGWKRPSKVLCGALLAGSMGQLACGPAAQEPANPPTISSVTTAAAAAPADAGETLPPVAIERLAEDVWMHSSYKLLPEYGPVVSHGLIVRAKSVIYLIDTAWENEQTDEILAWVKSNLYADVGAALVTHAHADKMGGVSALKRAGVKTYATAMTNQDALTRHLVPAEHELTLNEGAASWAAGAIDIFYPGAGHTRDNIVVYLKDTAVLFGGCLIRPGASDSMGNTADGDVDHWDDATLAVKQRYPLAKIVVPSHGPPGGVELLDHTISLATKAAAP